MPLADLFPGPAEAVTLGGRARAGRPLRLADLPHFERWAAACLGDPCEGLDEAAPDYPDRLRAAYDPARAWPPEFGDDAVWDLIHTPEGLALTVAIALDLSADAARALVDDEAVTPAEWSAFHAFAWSLAPSPYDEVVRRIDRLIGCPEFAPLSRDTGEPISWTRAVAEQAEGDPARLEAIGRLTLGQWRALRSGGESRRSEPIPGDQAARRVVMDLRGEFWAEERRRKREAKRLKLKPVDGPRDLTPALGRDVAEGGGLPSLGLGHGGAPLDGAGTERGQEALDEDAQRAEPGPE